MSWFKRKQVPIPVMPGEDPEVVAWMVERHGQPTMDKPSRTKLWWRRTWMGWFR